MNSFIIWPERSLWYVTAIFVASILITLVFWAIFPSFFKCPGKVDYTYHYEPVARNILAGRGLIDIYGRPSIHRPPACPFLLAGVFWLADLTNPSESVVLSVFILICMGLSSIFLFLIAKSIWGPLPALVCSLVWASYSLVLYITRQLGSENPFIVVFYGGFCLFWYALLRKSRTWPLCFLSGFLIGIAMIIRPIAIGVGLIMGAILLLTANQMTVRLRLFLALMVLLGNLVVVFP